MSASTNTATSTNSAALDELIDWFEAVETGSTSTENREVQMKFEGLSIKDHLVSAIGLENVNVDHSSTSEESVAKDQELESSLQNRFLDKDEGVFREDARRYLEKQGLLDFITKALSALAQEIDRPSDPIAFLKELMSGPQMDPLLYEENVLNQEKEEAAAQLKDLSTQVEELKAEMGVFGFMLMQAEMGVVGCTFSSYEDAKDSCVLRTAVEKFFNKLESFCSVTDFVFVVIVVARKV